MTEAAGNGPMFINAFYSACLELEAQSLAVPDVEQINRVLAENEAGYEIRPPDLVATTVHTPIPVPKLKPSFDEQAKAKIDTSLVQSKQLLDDGKARPAVQEILWLLESVSTAFRDDATVTGKYFNEIVAELQASSRGTPQAEILRWLKTLHGYLSSPTGGGVRHGVDLKEGVAMEPHEARLYCNLIRSYITFLIEEHRGGRSTATRSDSPIIKELQRWAVRAGG